MQTIKTIVDAAILIAHYAALAALIPLATLLAFAICCDMLL